MGTYLSTPVVDKCEEEGECSDLAWAVVDMQGWRKSMEDAHIAQTNVSVPTHLGGGNENAKVFGVFDGHGGAEVARFVSIYLVDVLIKQPTWVSEQDSRDPLTSPVGQALIDAFHALDRMIDQTERLDELIRLRTQKPTPGFQKATDHIPIPEWKEHKEAAAKPESIEMKEMPKEERESPSPERQVQQEAEEAQKETVEVEARESPAFNGEKKVEPKAADELESAREEPDVPEPDTVAQETEQETQDETTANDEIAEAVDVEAPKDVSKTCAPDGSFSEDESTAAKVSEVHEPTELHAEESPTTENFDLKNEDEASDAAPGTVEIDDDSDGDSDAVVGVEDAAKLDQDLLEEDSGSEEELESVDDSRKVSVMFQKFLNLSGSASKRTLKIGDKDAAAKSESGTMRTEPAAIIPTIIQNGRQICNLPDHPIHAGCTAIVAVLIGRQLTVANAGDSRGVLCRAGGRTEALSFDHKPSQDRELNRITSAGGFVNQFGRVNGNLNLSRSIGDLKYKQVPGIHPAGQMITAEPDIVEVFLEPNDEFFILGCDGIWDCLSNTQAVKYVRDKIDTMTPAEIGVKMLDEIISVDPRATQGIGGDNMTIMIIDLQPETRSYHQK